MRYDVWVDTSTRDERTRRFIVVNAAIRDQAAGLEQDTQPHEWEFWCECGEPSCRRGVWLTLAQYEQLRDHRHAILTPGHEVSEVARAAILVEEASALRAEAEHQVRRAKKNQARLKRLN